MGKKGRQYSGYHKTLYTSVGGTLFGKAREMATGLRKKGKKKLAPKKSITVSGNVHF